MKELHKKRASPKDLWKLKNLCLNSARKYRKRSTRDIINDHLNEIDYNPSEAELIRLYQELEEEREREIQEQHDDLVHFQNEEIEYLSSLQEEIQLPCPMCHSNLLQKQDETSGYIYTFCPNRMDESCTLSVEGSKEELRQRLDRALTLHHCPTPLRFACQNYVLSAYCPQCSMSGNL